MISVKKKYYIIISLMLVAMLAVLSSCQGAEIKEKTEEGESTTNLSDLISEDAKITEIEVLSDALYQKDIDGTPYLYRVLTVKNVCDKKLDIYFSDTAYDSSNKMIGLFSAGVYAVLPGKTAVLICSPIETGLEKPDHTTYNDPRDAFTINESSYTDYTDEVSFSETPIESGVEIVATNNGDNLGSIDATVLFFKEGKLVDCNISGLVSIASEANNYMLAKGVSSEKTDIRTEKEFDSYEVYYQALLEHS